MYPSVYEYNANKFDETPRIPGEPVAGRQYAKFTTELFKLKDPGTRHQVMVDLV